MKIDDLIQTIQNDDEQTPLVIGQDWGQGKTTFGGLSVALVVCAIKKRMSQDYRLYSLTSSFINPLLPDKEFSIETNVIKSGKTIAYLEGRVIQDDQVILTVSACFGIHRQSSLQLTAESKPNFTAPDQGCPFPYIPNVAPIFTKKVDYRLMQGKFPFQGSTETDIGGYMRFRDTSDSFSEAHLVALIDAWPPSMLPMLKKPAAASTLNWTIQFTQNQLPKNTQAWLSYRASTNHIANGIGHSTSEVWNEEGDLLALSHQTVVIYG